MRRVLLIVFVVATTLLLLPVSALATPKPPAGSGDGVGRVFFPNPVAQLQNQSLTDQKDADYAALQSAYRTVTLTNLDVSGFLSGDWAVVINAVGGLAYAEDKSFVYGRDDDRFEQVMAYYWVTEAQLYLRSLGFGTSRRGVNDHAQKIKINQFGGDNSFAKDQQATLTFGKGGVDDAEDAEVILHEYGHAIHFDQSAEFYSSDESDAIGEGFADYWAVTVTNVVAPTPDAPCVADWDAVSYTDTEPHCLRRIDENLHYPADLEGREHHDGKIWSRALWDIRQDLGHVQADTVILTAQFDWVGSTMADLASRTVAAAQALYGNAAANAVRDAFEDRGIL